MEARKFQTFDDLQTAWLKDERQELINGEIIKRPMARFEHSSSQNRIAYKLVNGKYAVIEAVDRAVGKVRIEPFVEEEFDLSYVFAE